MRFGNVCVRTFFISGRWYANGYLLFVTQLFGYSEPLKNDCAVEALLGSYQGLRLDSTPANMLGVS